MKTKIGSLILVVILCAMGLTAIPVSGFDYGMDTDLGDADASFLGEDADDCTGWSVAGAGDVNGDGYDDILIGSPWDDDDSYAGQTYLIFGDDSGWDMDTDLGDADASFMGENADDEAGYSVTGAGDVNGDGYDDILIGAPSNGDGGRSAGQVYLIFGNDSEDWSMDTDLSNADASFLGENTGRDSAGESVAGVGDVNGDGYDDILIGAPGYAIVTGMFTRTIGQIYLIFGNDSGWAMDTDLGDVNASFLGVVLGESSGDSVAGAGDVNGDGYDDILVGAYRSNQAYLIFGNDSGWAMDTDIDDAANASFLGEDDGDGAGKSVAGAGDVNGDGYDDILIGAYTDDDNALRAGQTYLILGKAAGWAMDTDLSNADASFLGEKASDYSGVVVAGAGDVNGDGYDDIMIGAPSNDDGGDYAGQVYLILGKSSGWAMDTDLGDADASFWGENADDGAGESVAGAGDVNGDGGDDILIASPWYDSDSYEGQTYLIFGDVPEVNTTGELNFAADLVRDGSQIVLTWQHIDLLNTSGYNIYRSTDGIEYNLYDSVGQVLRYSDSEVDIGRTYRYKVAMLNLADLETAISLGVEIQNDYDTDLDGIGNLFDQDDDGDGWSDGADAFPLDKNEWLDTDWDGIGNNADTDDDNDGLNDAIDAEPLNPLNGIQDEIALINSSLIDMNSSLIGMNSSLSDMNSSLIGMNSSLSDMNSILTDVNSTLTYVNNSINALQDDINYLNTSIDMIDQGIHQLGFFMSDIYMSLRVRIQDLETNLSMDLSGMNESLQRRLTDLDAELLVLEQSLDDAFFSLESDIWEFEKAMETDLDELLETLLAAIDGLDLNLTEKIDQVNNAIVNLDETSLADIKQLLNDVGEHLDDNNTEILAQISTISANIDSFQTNTNVTLQDISDLMAKEAVVLAELDEIEDDINNVNNAQEDLEKNQTKNKNAIIESDTNLTLGVIVLLIILAVMLVVMIMMIRATTMAVKGVARHPLFEED